MHRRRFLQAAAGSGVAAFAAQASGVVPLVNRVLAQNGDQQRTVLVDALNLREGPGLDYALVSTLAYGDIVSLISDVQWADGYGWVEVAVWNSTLTGWVAAEFIGTSSGNPAPGGTDYVVNTDALNLRSGPGLDYSVVAGLNSGTAVTTTGETSSADGYEWFEVDVPSNGLSGWVASAFLSADSGGNPPPSSTYVHVNTDALNLRSGAGLDYGVIATYPYNTTAVVTGSAVPADGYSWLPVMVDGNEGWFAEGFLAPGFGETPQDRIQVVDGPLNVRDEPSLRGSVVGSASTGMYATVLDPQFVDADGYSWVNVQFEESGVTGWVATAFVSYIDVA